MNLNESVSVVLPYFERPDVLELTLRSYQFLYSKTPIEIVIVDDGSRLNLKPKIPKNYTIPTKIVSIVDKDGINPCTPFNVGVRVASGELIVLSSPEIVHTESIFNSFKNSKVGKKECWFYNVFALTDEKLNSNLMQSKSHAAFMKIFSTFKDKLDLDLGFNGYSWANSIGSWYSHHIYRRTNLNFLSLIRRDSYIELGGFDERYRKGSGFDDLEFRERMISSKFHFHYRNSLPAIHLIHEEVSTRGDIQVGINSNEKLYNSFWTKLFPRRSIRFDYKTEIEEINF